MLVLETTLKLLAITPSHSVIPSAAVFSTAVGSVNDSIDPVTNLDAFIGSVAPVIDSDILAVSYASVIDPYNTDGGGSVFPPAGGGSVFPPAGCGSFQLFRELDGFLGGGGHQPIAHGRKVGGK